MVKTVRFACVEESKDWSSSANSSFSSLDEGSVDYQERVIRPPRLPVRKVSCEIPDDDFSEDDDDDDVPSPLPAARMTISILRKKSRYSSPTPNETSLNNSTPKPPNIMSGELSLLSEKILLISSSIASASSRSSSIDPCSLSLIQAEVKPERRKSDIIKNVETSK